MFEPAQITEYQNTTVPAEWKDDILAATDTKTKRPLRLVSAFGALAACLVLLVVGGVLINAYTAAPSVSIRIHDAASVMTARTDAVAHTKLTLSADGDIEVQTDADALYIISENGEKTLLTHTTANNTLTLEWVITTDSVEFTANGERFRLTYDAQNGNVSVQNIVPN